MVNINGVVSLPEGEIAPENGLNLSIIIQDENSEYTWERSFETSVHIPNGENSVEFSILAEKNKNYRMYYIFNNNLGYLQRGFYTDSNKITNKDTAKIISILDTNVDGIFIEIKKGILINGIVSLPNGEVAPEDGIELGVEAYKKTEDNRFDWIGAYSNVYIPSGENSAEYSIVVEDNGIYRINYWLYDSNDYIRMGYYSINGTTMNKDEATEVNVNGLIIEGLNIQLLKVINTVYDINYDYNIDLIDLNLVAIDYGLRLNIDPEFDQNKDFNNDGVIDIFDIVLVAKNIK